MKVAFLFGSLCGVAGVRRELSTAEADQAAQLNSMSGSDALQRFVSSHGESITPDVQSKFDAAADVLNNKVIVAIKESHDAAQNALKDAVDDLDAKTSAVVQDNEAADKANTDLFECRGEQKQLLKQTEDATAVLKKNRKTEETECGAVAGKEPFDATFTKLSFSCDMSSSTGCAKEIEELEAAQKEEMKRITREASVKRTAHTNQVNDCTDATNVANTQESKVSGLNKQFDGKLESCNGLQTSFQQVLCQKMAQSYKNKCASWDSYNQLKENIGQQNGGPLSEPDREIEWKATAMSNCLMQKFKMKVSMDTIALQDCQVTMVPYNNQFGALQFQDVKVQGLMTASKFSCQENLIQFEGVWDVPQDPRSSSTAYVQNDDKTYDVAVDLSQTNPFSVC